MIKNIKINGDNGKMISFDNMPEMYEDLKQVNWHIERLCKSNSTSMQEMMNWVLNARGKQIRPILTLLCSKLKGKKVNVTEFAAIIEMCHTASLIHDDIIDGADRRRGQLSVQEKFGKEMAVYAGDFMIFSTLGRTELRVKPWFQEMFAKLEIMCDGEVDQFYNHYNVSITEKTYIKNIVGKTSAMFEIACGAGAYEGKCNIEERKAVEQFARYFGLLFQIRDDLMDFIAIDTEFKKTIHNDFWCGYYTLPAIHTFMNPKYGEELKKIANKLQNRVYIDGIDEKIFELIHSADGFRYTVEVIEKYKDLAKKSLNIFKDSAAKLKLIELVEMLWESVGKLQIK